MVEFFGLEIKKKEKILQQVERLRAEQRREVLAQALGDRDPGIVITAVEKVGAAKVKELYPYILYAVRERQDQVSQAARSVLLSLPLEEFRRIAYTELGSVLFSMRQLVLGLLAERGTLDDVPRVLPLIFDYKIDVREHARRALYEIFAREIEQRRLGQAEHPVKIDEDLSKAIRWLYELMDGPDQINGMMAGRILVDFGALAPDVFWQRFGSMALKGRDTLARVLLQREDESALMVLYAGLLQASEQQASKCRQLLQRSLGNGIEPAHLSVLESLSEQTQARVARRMALYGLLREFLARFDRIAARQRGVVFDLLEHLDCRPYEPFLLSCLEREDDLLVYRALRLLIQLEDGGYMEEFKNLLHRSDPEILLAVLEYMRVHGDVGVIPSLSPLLAHWDERVARQTVTTVFQLSRQHLLARYEDLNESSRQEIINLLHRLDEDFVEELCEDLSRLSSQEKVHLVNILEIVGQESKIQSALLKLSREPDQRVRATVAKAIQIFSEAQKKLELTRAFLEDEDTRVRANAVESLQNVDNEEIRQRLIRMTRSPHRRERANAIKKLWDLGYRDFEMSLVQMLDEPDEWTRASAVWVLGEIEAPHLSDLVEEKLDDESAVVRENAIQALNKRGTTEQVRQLTRFLEDPDRRVREAAQMAMRQRLNLSYEIT